jgi:hypothetical protein
MSQQDDKKGTGFWPNSPLFLAFQGLCWGPEERLKRHCTLT